MLGISGKSNNTTGGKSKKNNQPFYGNRVDDETEFDTSHPTETKPGLSVDARAQHSLETRCIPLSACCCCSFDLQPADDSSALGL